MSDIFIKASDALSEVESRGTGLLEADLSKGEKKLGEIWAYVYEQARLVPVFKLGWIWGVAKNLEWQSDLAGRPYVPDMRFTD